MKALHVRETEGSLQVDIAPDSALVLRNNPWFLPADGEGAPWTARLMAAACIDRLGMHISEKFAGRYYSDLMIVAHTENACANASLAWVRDGSLVTGTGRIAATEAGETLRVKAGEQETEVRTAELLQALNRAIAAVSRYATLKTGDMVMLDLETEAIELAEGKDFAVTANGTEMLRFKTR